MERVIRMNYTFKEAEEIIGYLKGNLLFDIFDRKIRDLEMEKESLMNQVEEYRINV